MTHNEFAEIARAIKKFHDFPVNEQEGVVMILASGKEDRILKLFNGDSAVLVPRLRDLLIHIVNGLAPEDKLIAKQSIIEAAETIEGGDDNGYPETPQAAAETPRRHRES
nr:MAG TPA: hypothetical protein [Caudoviricetes sp.]